MPRALAVLGCSQIATLAGPDRPRVGPEMNELGLVPNGALLALDGTIRAVGSREEIEPQIPDDATVVDAGGRLLLPGFVDAHTHLAFAGNRAVEFEMRCQGRSYEQIAQAGGGILSTVRATREASLEELAAAARKRLGWMLAGGTTTIEAKSGYGLTSEDELRLLLLYRRLKEEGPAEIVPTLLAPHAVPPEYSGRAKDYMREVAVPLLRAAWEEGLAEFADAFVEEGYFDEEALAPYFEEAKSRGIPLRLHVDQLRESGGAALAARWGARTADHLEQTAEAGFEAMREAGVQPILLPGSVLGLGKTKYPDARKMIERGLAVVLATDFNPGSSPVASMPLILSLACTHMRMTPAEAICAVTANAAWSLNRGHDRGSLEPGKRADFALHEAEDYREIPYWIGRGTAWKVFVSGKELSLGA
jgi:imidazolonepropionase